MADVSKILATVRKAGELMRATPGRAGSVVRAFADEMMVVGDLHGNLRAFKWALAEAALDRNPNRHLVLQELIHEINKNDDDRPDMSHRLVDVVCTLKCLFPSRVHVILGNHELSELTGRLIGKDGRTLNDRFREGIALSYGDAADEVYAAYLKLFSDMPLAVRTPNRVFCCHTLPDGDWLDDFDASVLDAEIWPEEALKRRGAVYSITWGRDTTEETADRFAAIVDADLFVTGHQACDEGFRRANNRTLIVDGTEPYPTFCRFPARAPIGIDDLVASVKVMGLD
jgi:hypothetical protein